MVTLKTNWVSGDILTAGTTISTSGLNGITTAINSNTVTKLAYVGSDMTGGSIASSTIETSLATVTIPANAIATGALYIASVSYAAQAAQVNDAVFKIKSGAVDSEATRQTLTYRALASSTGGGNIAWYDSASTWTAPVKVVVTGKNGDSNAASICTVHSLAVIGV